MKAAKILNFALLLFLGNFPGVYHVIYVSIRVWFSALVKDKMSFRGPSLVKFYRDSSNSDFSLYIE